MTVVLPVINPSPATAGLMPRDNGGYEYSSTPQDTKRIWQQWPASYPGENDMNQGIALDPVDQEYVSQMTDFEGPPAVFQNGGATQVQPPMSMVGTPTGNPVDEIVYPWTGTGPSPYQVDTNIIGPVSGRSEGMTGTTLQPNYAPVDMFKYGASTGGGTSQHETVTAYYAAQVAQVQRDYSAAAFFAST